MAKSKTKVRKRAQASRWAWLAQEGSRLSAIFARPRNQDEAEIFSAAYRRGATELARVRAFSPDRRQVEYLEQAVATAHFAAHRASAPRPKTVLRGLVFGMPDLIRRYAKYHLLALAITLGAAAIGMLAVLHEPSTYHLFVGSELAGGRNPSASKEFLEESLRSGRGDSSDEHAVFSAFLFQHNTRIAMLCFAVGIFLGLPTIYLLIVNGLMLGAFIGLYARVGLEVELLAWLLPHGVPEIGAIILCGGAGIALGHGLLNPTGLRERAADAAMTVIACVPLLLIAAFIEGFFRQSEASTGARYALFALLLVALAVWIFLVRGQWRTNAWAGLKAHTT